MKVEIKLAYRGTPTKTFEMEGDLDKVKTYLKLAISDNFTWGAIIRLDTVANGEVDRWVVRKGRDGTLLMKVFSFFGVNPEVNINAFHSAFKDGINMEPINKLLGGGRF